MTALATETAATANGAANGPQASQMLHVEHRCGRTGHRIELVRYTVCGGEVRILYGQRVDGVVRVTDVPADEGGRAYLVERDLETKSELDALIVAYLEHAARLGSPPIASFLLESYPERAA